MNLDKLGYMRENFHGETGEPLYADYFYGELVTENNCCDMLDSFDKTNNISWEY